MSCGYNYNIEFENLDEIKSDVLKIFKSIIKNDEEFKYFMKTISSFLIQNNIEEKAWLRAK